MESYPLSKAQVVPFDGGASQRCSSVQISFSDWIHVLPRAYDTKWKFLPLNYMNIFFL